MKKLYVIFTTFLLFQINVFGQLEFLNREEQKILSSEQLTDAFNVNLDSLMLDSIITAFLNAENIPGSASLITKNNELIWNKNYGYRNLEHQLPVEDSTLFLMASISKTFMATAVMQLWENNLIELEGNINDYLPSGFTVVNPYYPSYTITVKMLMTHTASLADNWNILDPLTICGDSPIRLDSFLVNYFSPGGIYYSVSNFYNYPPGQQWNYTNVGSSLLALMVEHLSGKSFDQYCRDSIFIPLSMNASSWFLEGLDTNKIATPYEWTGGQYVVLCHQGWPLYPVVFLRTNKIDLSNFLSAYMNGGIFNNNRILNSSTITMMLSDQCGYVHLNGGKQGLIWFSYPAIFDTVWGHTGGWDGARNYMFFNPQEKWGLTFFMNRYTPNFPPIAHQIANYAHLYGNIYALRPSVDKSYSRKTIDSVLFRTRFSNRSNHQFIPRLIFANIDSTQIDSLTLFDDGLHGDSLSNDGIYGGYIPPQQTEIFYSLGVSTIDNQTSKYFNTPDICKFTTVGPVTLDSVNILYQSSYIFVKPLLKNNSTVTTITNASARLICNDPWVTAILPTTRDLPDIPPGAIVGPSAMFRVDVDTSIFPEYFNFKVEVTSNGWPYWIDSMRVPPIAIININPTVLAFGGVQIDSSETKTFVVTNYGDEDLIVSNIASSEPVFTVNITSAVIPPDSSQDVEVTFTPTALQTYSGVIEIIHNTEGSPDTIIVTGDGVTDVEDDLQPLVYSLEQNYPNPFNPSTTIKYSLPKASKVILKMYNLLGEEVATLVNEEKVAGYFTVEFNAANLPSGIYFYQLRAGDYLAVKKMLLLK